MSPICPMGWLTMVADVTLRDDVRAMLVGREPDADALGDGAGLDIGDVPAELVGTALSHFADTAPLADADALAPIVTAASPIPFDAELDGVGETTGPATTDLDAADQVDADLGDADPGDRDPDDVDRADALGGLDGDSNGDDAAGDDGDPGDFDGTEHSTGRFGDDTDRGDISIVEHFGSGDATETASLEPESPEVVETTAAAQWDDDPFSFDDIGEDPVAAETPLVEFEPIDTVDDVDDGFGVDPDDGFDTID